MPELPEVETICRGLMKLNEKKVKNFFKSDKKLRIESKLDFKLIKNAKITQIHRRARYIIIDFDNKKSLIIHLGMSGRIIFRKDFKKLKHDHFILEFDDGNFLIFNDPRRFGFVDLLLTKDLEKHQSIKNLGPEPFSKEFNAKYLFEKLKNKKINIKTAMMDNKIVVGVGNIYINESLFDSKISPLRQALSLKFNEVENLVNSIKKILKKAIDSGGSSINDYVDLDGNVGNFQENFQIYQKNDKKCLHCKCLIKRIVQNGRSTFYCEKCQK